MSFRPFFLIVVFAYSQTAYCQELNLEQAYKMAQETSERLKISETDVRIAEARYQEALGALYPTLNLNVTERLRDSSTSSNSNSDNSNGSGSFGAGRSDRFLTAISVTQPIFRGFRDIALADAAKAEKRGLEYIEIRRRQELFLSVAQLYYQIYLFDETEKLLKQTDGVISDRITELKNWLDLGKSRDSEVDAALADKADLNAALAAAIGSSKSTRELLAFFTGSDLSNAKFNGKGGLLPSQDLNYFLVSGKNRPDLKAIDASIESLELQVFASEREHWPSIDFEGNAYPIQDPSGSQDWDVLFRLSMPLFDGWRIDSRTAQREGELRNANLRYQELSRQIESDIKRYFQDVQTAKERVKLLKVFVDNTQRSYESQRKDYELGIVNNLDVLQSIRQVLDAKGRMLQAQVDLLVSYAQLKAASGAVQL